ncbi:unnamed protein product [Ilex paraguariensis]|uniref:Uncharacterized protein n=1 Tax=Ilex paraguariensis TaxID=185542 RepID=A0ABC8U0H0_9AQUA
MAPSFTCLCLLFQLILTVGGIHDHQDRRGTTPEGYLQMPQNSPFKIVLFADLHFGEAEETDWGPIQDVNSTRVMSTVLDIEHPVEGQFRHFTQHKPRMTTGMSPPPNVPIV